MTTGAVRRIARDMDGSAYLWVATWDDAGYHFRVWRLSPFDVRAIETWERMMAMRRSNGLPELPMPDLSDTKPEQLSVLEPEHALEFLAGRHEPALERHAAELIREIECQRPREERHGRGSHLPPSNRR